MQFKAILETDKAHADVQYLLDRYRGTRAAGAVTVSAPVSFDDYTDWLVDVEIDTDSLEGAKEIVVRLDLDDPDGDNGFILRDLAPAEPAPGMSP